MTNQGKPLVTFALLAYNQERFIRQAVEGALAQDYENLQIIISDDCSTDQTANLIINISSNYSGDHRVHINRNKKNIGLVRHFNKVLSLAEGEIVVVAAGDDISISDRVSRSVELFNKYSNISVVSFSDHIIDADAKVLPGKKNSNLKKDLLVNLDSIFMGNKFRFSGASRAFRKEVFDIFGPLYPHCPSEDTPMLLRSLMLGCGVISPYPGIYYRRHDANLSRPSSIHAMDIDSLFRQYKNDLNKAASLNIVDERLKYSMEKIIDSEYKRRTAKKEFYMSKNRAKYFFMRCLFSSFLTLNDKLSLAKLLLLRAVRPRNGTA